MSNARKLADNLPTEGQLGNRNFIINGDMKIFQRATAATAVANNYTTADRWKAWNDSTYGGAMTTEKSTDVPSGQGFSNSLKFQCSTASTSTAAAEYAQFNQPIEAQNCQAFAYGTSGAKTLTLSFWCKSNKTGVYTVAFRKDDSTTYIIPIEYTISSADTWEKKTITVSPTAGNTTLITNSGGAIANDNGSGLEVYWNLLLGSNYTGGTSGTWSTNASHYSTTNAVNWLDNTANNFYITGVQLEVGDKATPFEHEPYSVSLAKAQRYYQLSHTNGQGYVNANQHVGVRGTYRTEMRVAPTVTLTLNSSNQNNMSGSPAIHINGTHGYYGYFTANNAGNYYYYYNGVSDAEL